MKVLLRRLEVDKLFYLAKIKKLDIEIRKHYTESKKWNVRRNIILGNNKSLWKAVNIFEERESLTHSLR